MPAASRPAERLIRRARLAEGLTLAWMAVELVVALWAGIVARSVALTTFGVDSGIELFTAAVVLRLFILHTERATEEELDARERQAARLVGWGLYGLIAYILARRPGAWRAPAGRNRRLSVSCSRPRRLSSCRCPGVGGSLWPGASRVPRCGPTPPARLSASTCLRSCSPASYSTTCSAGGWPTPSPPWRYLVGPRRGARGARGGADRLARRRRLTGRPQDRKPSQRALSGKLPRSCQICRELQAWARGWSVAKRPQSPSKHPD